MARVLAEAGVGYDEQVGMGVLDRTRRELNDAFVVPRPGALGVLLVGDAEQHDAGNPERRELTAFGNRLRDRET